MAAQAGGLELWAGPECTIVRIGDEYRDQAQETGHATRSGDIAAMADLGVTAVRYPILWESIAPDNPDRFDFSLADERLAMLRERGVAVIGGLLHHGSGPHYTDLLDPDFPKKLGAYAARVAERYPWIEMWTPVNEPLTTARFSALYGHWYPHARGYRSFFRALVNQCLGTMAAMRAIRAVNPGALLVQTEDLGKTFSTAPLRQQAAHENERRWLSFDLLCGKVGARHPLYRHMIDAGIAPDALARLASGKATPDLIGINHYLTSERFLDHRTGLYPGHDIGGNGRDAYVDAEAVRVKRLRGDTGIGPRLREAWARYRIPMAVTEVHHGCTRDEQLRWLAEVWETAGHLRDDGVDLRAVTLWSTFGNVDWRSLITRRDGVYDVGAFDVRGPQPRPTALARAARAYGHGESFDHPVLDTPGWWRRPERLYPWSGRGKAPGVEGRKLLITGATGTLGQALARVCGHRGLPFRLTGRDELDIGDQASIAAALARHKPWALINGAGFVRVVDAERETEACMLANAKGPALLAEACSDAGIPLIAFSSDLIFDGTLGRPYRESDPVCPAGAYGRSKAEMERGVADAGGKALIVRTSAFFGPWDIHNFAHHTLATLARGETVTASANIRVSPTFVPDLCHAALDLLIDGESGIWHLANKSELSWYDLACRVAEGAGYEPARLRPVQDAAYANTALTSERGVLLRPVEEAIEAYLRQIGQYRELGSRFALAAE